jgi:hypothetical protein
VTAAQLPAGRFRLAPVDVGGASWDLGVDLILAPQRLSAPVRVVLAPRPRAVSDR